MILFVHLIMHYIFCDLTFWVCWKIWAFSKLKRFLQNFWDGFCFNDPKCSCIALHLHFNYIFMHYRCMLVELDWAELMMFLLLHITCSCIFHAFVPSFHYILILICVGVFLFFYLSLFLSLASSMAPKHKSAPSQNPLHSGASSFDPIPSHIQFHDDKAWKDFSKNFSWRGIHSERQVIPLDFSNIDLPTVIYSRGWESLCGIPVTCLFVII